MTEENSTEREVGLELAGKLGKKLAGLRKRKKFSVQEIAESLRITSTQVKSIETGDWSQLGAPVYAKGYIRGYARAVGMDLPCLDEVFGEQAQPQPAEIPLRQQKSAIDWQRSGRWVGYVASTGLLIPMLYLLVTQTNLTNWFQFPWQQVQAETQQSDESGSPQTDEVEKPVLASMTPRSGLLEAHGAEPEEQTQLIETTIPPLAVSENADVAADGEEEVLDGVSDSEVPVETGADELLVATAEAIDATGPSLILELTEPVWMEVFAADGERLAYGLVDAPAVRQYPAEAGLSLRLGNATTIRATLSGEPFDLTPYMRNDVAQLKLTESHLDSQ